MLRIKYYLLTLIKGIFVIEISQYFLCSNFANQRDNWRKKACQRKLLVQIRKFQKVFSRDLSRIIMSKIHGNREKVSLLRFSPTKLFKGKINFSLRKNKKQFKKSFALIITKKC